MRWNTERILRLLEAARQTSPADRDVDALHAMKSECSEVETSVSYLRRLAQGRIEILEAEEHRRSTGGSVGDLIADLPRILAGGGGRSAAANARLAEPDVAIVELHWPDQREDLVSDDVLANLPVVDDATLVERLASLREFERELSDLRRRLHEVLGGVEHEIATRAADAVG